MYSIVIIDDEVNIAEGIAHIFPWNEMGFEVVKTFSKSREGLEYISNNKVDVLICDIEMPELNGIELVALIKETGIRTVYISGYQNFEYLRAAIQNQVVDYLLKPIKYSDLSECFQQIKDKLDEENTVCKEEKPNGYYENIINAVIEYLEKNYQMATLELAAEEVRLSSSYLSKIFREHADKGFYEHLMEIRMKKACEFLMDFKNKSYDVAYFVGYDNPKNFSRAFKNYYGITISEFKKNNEIPT